MSFDSDIDVNLDVTQFRVGNRARKINAVFGVFDVYVPNDRKQILYFEFRWV